MAWDRLGWFSVEKPAKAQPGIGWTDANKDSK
jgi:hypothetical protein